MKRWTLAANFLLFIAICASAAYWGMQLFAPQPTLVAAPPAVQAESAPGLGAASGLLGGRSTSAPVATNFRLTGVVASEKQADSVAILAVNGKPPQAFRTNAEILPGVTVKEVHKEYVLISESGVTKRVDLPATNKAQTGSTRAATAVAPAQNTPAQSRLPTPSQQSQVPQAQPAVPAQQSATAGSADQATTALPQQGRLPPAAGPNSAEGDPQMQDEDTAENDPAQSQANPPRR